MIFTDTITVYNHYTQNGTDMWKKTVLKNCQWSPDKKMDIDADGQLQVARFATISIPYRDGFVQADDFEGQGFTLQTGNLDVVALGARTEEITEDNLSAMLKKEQFLTIISVNDNTNRDHLKYWRVMAA